MGNKRWGMRGTAKEKVGNEELRREGMEEERMGNGE